MINKIRITNFKCFKDEILHFKPLTILAGANASGKSSVIQALLLLQHSNDFIINLGDRWSRESININQIFGFQVGAPNALISQNPIEEESFDFAFMLEDKEKEFIYQYQIDKSSPLDLKVKRGDIFQKINMQYLNAERIGPRVANQAGEKGGITHDGENAAYLMDVADKMNRKIAAELIGEETVSQKFSYYVEKWMGAILGDVQLDFHTDYNKAITELKIKNSLVDTGVVPTLTGFGISYVLPVVVAGLWATGTERSLLVLENPEAHLHPYAQSNIGKFLALLAGCGVQVVVETHSEHIIDGARWQMARQSSSEKMLVNFLQQAADEVKVSAIYVSPSGELSMWPKGFFDQKQQDLRELMMLRRKDVYR